MQDGCQNLRIEALECRIGLPRRFIYSLRRKMVGETAQCWKSSNTFQRRAGLLFILW